jgi:hypothetical protein
VKLIPFSALQDAEYRCLVRATDGKKKISTAVSPFPTAYLAVIVGMFKGLLHTISGLTDLSRHVKWIIFLFFRWQHVSRHASRILLSPF